MQPTYRRRVYLHLIANRALIALEQSMTDEMKRLRRKVKPREGGGASAFGFGLERPIAGKSQQEIVKELVVWLEGRRALSAMYEAEGEWYVNMSLLDIREELADILPSLDDSDEAWAIVRNWRDRCNDYLTAVPDPAQVSNGLRPKAANALKRVRESFRIGLLTLAAEYDIPEARDLANRIALGMN